MADPLTASGLCWAYNAPLLLVSKNASKNEEQLIRLDDMAHFNGNTGSHPFKVHVVGGAASIPTTVYNSIAAAVGGASHVERISGATRYDVAKNIALRMRNVRSDQRGGVLFANGADPDKYFDALALSAITAKNCMPILLVQKDSVPAATTSALSQLTGTTAPRFVAGGTATVAGSVLSQLGATRWAGADRYATAAKIASEAQFSAYLSSENVAIASKIPDALSAGAAIGYLGGPVLVVKLGSLPSATRAWFQARPHQVHRLWPVEGPASISNSVITAAANACD